MLSIQPEVKHRPSPSPLIRMPGLGPKMGVVSAIKLLEGVCPGCPAHKSNAGVCLVGGLQTLTPAPPWHSHSGNSQCSRPWVHCRGLLLASGGGRPRVRLLDKSGPSYGSGAPRVRRTPESETWILGTARPVVMGAHGLGASSVNFPAHGGMPSLASSGPSPISGRDIQTISCGRGSR